MEERAKAQQALSALEDLLESEAEWRGVASVVRLACRAAHALARHSLDALEAADERIAAKVDRDDLKKAFKFKANIADVEESLDKVSEALESKVSIEDLEAVLENYVRIDNRKNDLEDGEAMEELETRVKKLEDVTFTLASQEHHGYAQNFVTRAEFAALETDVNVCVKTDEFDDLKMTLITRPELDRIIENELLPDLASQMREIQQGTKEKLDTMIEEIEGRVNLDEFSVLRRDIERLLHDQEGHGTKSQLLVAIDKLRQEQVNLNDRIIELESIPNLVNLMKNDLKGMAAVNRDIQENLSKIAEEIQSLPITTRVNEIDHQVNTGLKAFEGRVKRLEAADKRTHEILEILSKGKLKDNDRLDDDLGTDSNRSRSFAKGTSPQVVEQVAEIKSYVDKRIRKVEAVYASRDDFDKLEDKIDEAESSHNKILDALKDMISELNTKLKGNYKYFDERLEKLENKVKKDGKQAKAVAKSSVVAQLDDTSKVDAHNRSSSSTDKLKNLDGLILKVTGLVNRKAAEDGWKEELLARMCKIEDQLETKADKVKTSKLLDRKADINKALLGIHEELDRKGLANISSKDRSAEGVLMERNGLGQLGDSTIPKLHEKYAMWFWRSNSLSNNGLVVWDAESANSDPQCIIWDRFRSGFILVPGGLYEISFGFFGTAKPQVEILLNDSPILASRVGKGQEKLSGHFEAMHSSGNVTGLTCIEYVVLPPKAKLAVALKGNVSYEGFFLIKKL